MQSLEFERQQRAKEGLSFAGQKFVKIWPKNLAALRQSSNSAESSDHSSERPGYIPVTITVSPPPQQIQKTSHSLKRAEKHRFSLPNNRRAIQT